VDSISRALGGARLLADARSRAFDEIWVYKLDRLGRRHRSSSFGVNFAKHHVRSARSENLENDLSTASGWLRGRGTPRDQAPHDGRYEPPLATAATPACALRVQVVGEKPAPYHL
jgi:hypothetical protein